MVKISQEGLLRLPTHDVFGIFLEHLVNPLLKAAIQGLTEWVLGVDEAFVVEMIGFHPPASLPSPTRSPIHVIELACWGRVGPPLGTLDFGCLLLRMMLQDGRMLDFMGSAVMGSLGKELVVKG